MVVRARGWTCHREVFVRVFDVHVSERTPGSAFDAFRLSLRLAVTFWILCHLAVMFCNVSFDDRDLQVHWNERF